MLDLKKNGNGSRGKSRGFRFGRLRLCAYIHWTVLVGSCVRIKVVWSEWFVCLFLVLEERVLKGTITLYLGNFGTWEVIGGTTLFWHLCWAFILPFSSYTAACKAESENGMEGGSISGRRRRRIGVFISLFDSYECGLDLGFRLFFYFFFRYTSIDIFRKMAFTEKKNLLRYNEIPCLVLHTLDFFSTVYFGGWVYI